MNLSFEQWIIIFDTTLKYLVAIFGAFMAGGLYKLAKDRADWYKERLERAEKEIELVTVKSEEERQKYIQNYEKVIEIQKIDIENLRKAKLNEPTKLSSIYGLASAMPTFNFDAICDKVLGQVKKL